MDAIRRARMVKQERDAERLRRERQVEAALADFFEQTALAEALREQAEAKAARILQDMDEAIKQPREKARAAVRTLAELRETRVSIATLTGLSAQEVRDALADEPEVPTAAAGVKLPPTRTTVAQESGTSASPGASDATIPGAPAVHDELIQRFDTATGG